MIQAKHLRRDGIVTDDPMPIHEVDAIVAHFTGACVHRYHVAKTDVENCSYQEALDKQWAYFAASFNDVVMAPHWLERAISHYNDAKTYFSGRSPYLYSLNAFWTFPSSQIYSDTQGWHRDDSDGPDQFTVFMFGTDVNFSGRHQYARGSNNMPYRSPDPFYGAEPPEDIVTSVYGPRGTIIVEDTHGLHRAASTLDTPRLLLWARWNTSSVPFESYTKDGLSPFPKEMLGDRYPKDPVLQDAIQLLVR
jgi:hypothetical protein